jgi:hypothetical protein
MTITQTEKALSALDTVMNAGQQLIKEAIKREADIKQGRLASEACGRVTGAVKAQLDYRLAAPRLAEIEAKTINAVPGKRTRRLKAA